jgi:hypothetical protein
MSDAVAREYNLRHGAAESLNRAINRAFIGISRRAESVDRKTLVNTFIDIGPLLTVLSSRDHQIVYGRRGTGKTHALVYLAEQESAKGSASVYVDLRNIGSSGGIYGDPNIPLPQRATRLALDLTAAIHDELLNAALTLDFDLSTIGPALDELASASTEIEVLGETKIEEAATKSETNEQSSGAQFNIRSTPEAALNSSSKSNTSGLSQSKHY